MLPKRLVVASLLGLMVAAAGCAAPSGDDSGSSQDSAFTGVEDQSGIDVQALQIWTVTLMYPQTRVQYSPGLYLDATSETVCPTIRTVPSLSGWTDREVDCGDAFAKGAAKQYFDQPGPNFTDIKFHVSSQNGNPAATYVDPDDCKQLELRVVARDASTSAASFAGIGFATSHGETFVPKAKLQAVGHTTLKNGDAATVYRFAGIGTCTSGAHNSTSGNMYQTFYFKPYAAFDVPDGGDVKRFRKWEAINGNHVLGRSWPGEQPVVNSDGFNREGDLLAH